ncbi:hypothetical protein DBDeUG_0872 [Chlamydia pecorum]|uniref:hypothetical protein n=1 Tax=Chlamydia pecorum TaxID=85991 RepID=UPI0003D3E9CB|nr:hypothetical protein [Chlamydia pecorum]ETF37248.1 hypothetical protein CpecF_0856 [Chlamydia pecorum DBDeUG]UBV33368.1 hypothetical protein DBDeUG_0872 [Chlamydia pecorum]
MLFLKECCSGIGSVNCSPQAIPPFENKPSGVARVALAVFVALAGLGALLSGIVSIASCCGLGVVTGIGCVLFGMVALAWAIMLMLRLAGVGRLSDGVKAEGSDGEGIPLIPHSEDGSGQGSEGGVGSVGEGSSAFGSEGSSGSSSGNEGVSGVSSEGAQPLSGGATSDQDQE